MLGNKTPSPWNLISQNLVGRHWGKRGRGRGVTYFYYLIDMIKLFVISPIEESVLKTCLHLFFGDIFLVVRLNSNLFVNCYSTHVCLKKYSCLSGGGGLVKLVRYENFAYVLKSLKNLLQKNSYF